MSSTSLYSGRLGRNGYEFLDSIDAEEEQLQLLQAIARSEPIRKPAIKTAAVGRYNPIYRHPLPISGRRYNHDILLSRVLSCTIEKQAAAAVSDRWSCDPKPIE